MTSMKEPARQILIQVRKAIEQGDRRAARRLAEKAAEIDPGSEEPWLFLAALASPSASVYYYHRALKINPHSQWAQEGLALAEKRLNQKPNPPLIVPDVVVSKDVSVKFPWISLAAFLLILCLAAMWIFWPGNAIPVSAYLHPKNASANVPGNILFISKPTYTLSPTPTFTFTPTITSTPTPTFTWTYTETLTNSATPTSPLASTGSSQFQNTTIPVPSVAPTIPAKTGSNGGVKWIDVDLTKQRLYAYEGNTVVASFLVSTGVKQFPTVTGQYHIYIKLRSTLMHGVGYYLPNVPYTMYFYKGYGIHGTYWHHNFGHPMSHGCVNMYTPDAEWMYNWAPLGTLVNIHY